MCNIRVINHLSLTCQFWSWIQTAEQCNLTKASSELIHCTSITHRQNSHLTKPWKEFYLMSHALVTSGDFRPYPTHAMHQVLMLHPTNLLASAALVGTGPWPMPSNPKWREELLSTFLPTKSRDSILWIEVKKQGYRKETFHLCEESNRIATHGKIALVDTTNTDSSAPHATENTKQTLVLPHALRIPRSETWPWIVKSLQRNLKASKMMDWYLCSDIAGAP